MKDIKPVQLIYLFIGFPAFMYVLYRAINIGVTYDEVWTLKGFVTLNFISILNYSPCDANNHIMNTILIKLLFLAGNHNLFIARLPNVLAFIIYIYFSYKIAYRFLSSFIGICLFLLLLLNPFVLDFFSLARGYGLSLGFLMASIYYFIAFFSAKSPKGLLLSFIFGALAVLSNFTLLNYFLAILVVANLASLLFNTQFKFKQSLKFSSFVVIPLILILYEPVRKLSGNGSLYYGGNTGFYSDTLISLAKYTCYTPNSSFIIASGLNAFILILAISVLLSLYYNRQILNTRNLLLSIIVFCISSVVMQHYLLGTLYLIDRTALFFYPLFILGSGFALDTYSEKWFSKVIATILVCSFSINFFLHANVYKTATWFFDAHTYSILNELNDIGKAENRKIKIDFSWPFQSSMHYYNDNSKFAFIEIIKNNQNREDVNTSADYYIYLDQSLEKVGYNANSQKINSISRDTFKLYEKEKVVIFNHLQQ